jgi:hypothetical protein
MPPVPVLAALIRVELTAPGSIALGESVQLTATAVGSDGSVENVTTLAQWTSSDSEVLEISATGVGKAIARGEAVVTVRYSSRSATARTFVLPAGTYPLDGAVTDSSIGIAGEGSRKQEAGSRPLRLRLLAASAVAVSPAGETGGQSRKGSWLSGSSQA